MNLDYKVIEYIDYSTALTGLDIPCWKIAALRSTALDKVVYGAESDS
jgi:hypothetical protein